MRHQCRDLPRSLAAFLVGLVVLLGRPAHANTCALAASDGRWRVVPVQRRGQSLPSTVAARNASEAVRYGGETLLFEWAWTQRAGCNISRQPLDAMRRLFGGKSVAFYGDSHMRRFHAYLDGRLVRGVGVPTPQAKPPIRLAGGGVLTYTSAFFAGDLDKMLQRRTSWPSVLVMNPTIWHSSQRQSLQGYISEMRALLQTLKTRVPPTTTIVWVNPPAKAAAVSPGTNPPDWIHIFTRVAGDLGFFKPRGPAFQIDSFALAQDCLPWCMLDGAHLGSTASEVLLQSLANLLMQLDRA